MEIKCASAVRGSSVKITTTKAQYLHMSGLKVLGNKVGNYKLV
jgi:hypothetical protein